jgi:hypothetical protein
MRNGLFLGALLATMMIGGTALAERGSDQDNKPLKSKSIKERVLEKQKEGFGTKTTLTSSRRDAKQTQVRGHREKGEVYGDQATRNTDKSRASSGGKNLSATNSVNNPSEIRAMLRMINPMVGAYRTSQADEGTDSYGGASPAVSRSGSFKSADGKQRNLSATGSVNNPSEIKHILKMINPMLGAYSTCQAAEGTDSYTSNIESSYGNLMNHGDRATRNVHFKNDKGEVMNSMKADSSTAKKGKETRERLSKVFAEKMTKKLDTSTDVAKKSIDVK